MTSLKCVVLSSLLFNIGCTPMLVDTAVAQKSRTTIASATTDEVKQDMIMLAVDKSTFTAKLMTWSADITKQTVLGSFQIAYGKKAGDKQYEGDNRTPEGIYFSQRIIDGKTLPPKYGPYAIPINFPNPIDLQNKKTGHGIWLHGEGDAHRIVDKHVTEGCVAFLNHDIVKLTSWLHPRQGLVIISENGDVNKADDVNTLKDATEKWSSAWAARRVAEYGDAYDEKFKYKRMNIDAYRNYKKRVFASYKQMIVRFSDLRVATHPDYGVSVMNQDFIGDSRYKSYGRKTLYWKKDSRGSWKIVHEDFSKMPIRPVKLAKSELTLLSPDSSSSISTKNKNL